MPADQREFLLKEITASNKNIEKLAFLEYDSLYADKLENGMELNRLENGVFVAELSNQNSSPQFRAAVKGDNYFGSVRQKDGDFLMAVAAPVKNKDGIMIGVMSGGDIFKADNSIHKQRYAGFVRLSVAYRR